MAISPSPLAPATADHGMPSKIHVFTRVMRSIRAVAKTAIFFLKVFLMLPSRPLDWVTRPPVIERVRYPGRHGQVELNALMAGFFAPANKAEWKEKMS